LKLRTTLALLVASSLTPWVAHAADPQRPQASQDNQSHDVSGIVITAQRREEQLTQVPIAITAKTGQQLIDAGINSTMDLGLVTPGLYYAQQGNSAQPTIRGIGTAITTPGADANVSLYIDDVYQSNQSANNFQFNDIQDVAVFKGPQGTLFGRNSTGGTIAIKTRDPSWTPFGDLYLSYGSFNDLRASFYGTAPITDTLAANISFYADHDNGFMNNLYTNTRIAQSNVYAIRGKLLWKPTDHISFTLGLNYGDAMNSAPFSNRVKDGDTSRAFAVAQAGQHFPTGLYEASYPINPVIDTKIIGGNLHANFETGLGTFKSITAYQYDRVFIQVDGGVAPIPTTAIYIWDAEKTISQEVNFASRQIGPISFIAGIYYYYDWYRLNLNVTTATTPLHVVVDQQSVVTTDAVSGFLEVNWDITDRLRLIAGGRYGTEAKTQSGCNAFPAFPTNSVSPCGTPPYGPHTDRWNTFDPRVVLQYRPDDFSQIYFSYSVGDKSGNYNVGVTTPVRPEKNTAFELGYKRSQGWLTFDVSGYYYNYKDLQVQTLTGGTNGSPVLTSLTNAEGAKIYGIDGDFTARINEYWRVNVGAAWLHGTYSKFPGATLTTPIFACAIGGVLDTVHGACTGGVGTTFSNGNSQLPIDASGKNLIRAPQWMADATVMFNHPLPVGAFQGSVTVAYNGGLYWDPYNEFKEPAYTIVNTKLTWILPNEKVRISFWGTNLTGARYSVWVAPAAAATSQVPGRPRSMGVSIDVKI